MLWSLAQRWPDALQMAEMCQELPRHKSQASEVFLAIQSAEACVKVQTALQGIVELYLHAVRSKKNALELFVFEHFPGNAKVNEWNHRFDKFVDSPKALVGKIPAGMLE